MADKEASLLLRIKQVGGETIDKIGSSFAKLGQIAAGVFAGLSAVVAKSIAEYSQQEKAVNSLNQTLVQQGIYTADLSKEYENLANALSKKSTFDDAEIIASQSVLQGYLGQTKVTKELITATMDLAAAKGIDLKSASDLVGKSIGTTTNALGRQGIQVDANASKTEKMSQVIDGLNSRMGGQALAATQGMSGALIMFEKSTNDVFKALGERLQPVVIGVTESFTKMAEQLQNNEGFLAGMTQATKLAAQFGVGLYGVFKIVAATLSGTLATALGAVSQLMEGNFKQAYETVTSGASGMKDDITNSWAEIGKNIDSLDEMFLAKRQETNVKLLEQQAAHNAEMITQKQEQQALDDEAFNTKSADEILKLQTQEAIKADAKKSAQLIAYNNEIANAQTQTARLDAENKKRLFMEEEMDKKRRANMTTMQQLESFMNSEKFRAAEQTMGQLSRMQDSKNKELVAIGKAAAIAQIGIDTAKGVIGIWGWAGGIPFVGPAIAAGLSGALIAYAGEQISRVNSQHMAEGGIVKAQSGGMLATIGEGGKDEAVIPLEDGRIPGTGEGITIIVNGGLLGDQASARELARALDRELLRLRQANESQAFDTGVV